MHRRIRETLIHYAQGLLMGAADVIPGVSGGTMALIVGIYTRLIAALSDLVSAFVAAVRLDVRSAVERARSVEWGLVLPLGLGIVTALLVGARVILSLLERFPHESLGLFFGLVAASIAIPWRRIERKSVRSLWIAAAAALVAFVLTGIPPGGEGSPSLLRVFGTASIAICAMILPGVSGAFLLKAMGMYEVTLAALNARDLVYVLVFVLGAAFGLGVFSRILNRLLQTHYDATMAALVGLMTGALRALWPWQAPDRTLHAPAAGDPVLFVLLLAALGFLLVWSLVHMGDWSQRRVER